MKQSRVRPDRPVPTVQTHANSKTWNELDIPVGGFGAAAPDDSKPPYVVPSMADIAALPWNGLNAISTFSGCGGSSLGYKMAGFRVLWANEFVEAARDSYAANAPDTILDARDIRTLSAQDILDAIGMQRGDLDLLDGSPPCSSFSTAGKRARDWGKEKSYSDTTQRTDDLFFEFVRLLDGLQPRAFVAENVSGLVKGVAKGYFIEILKAMKACGYDVKARLLDAQWLGVPQQRQRIIFIGMRSDLGLVPRHPKPLPYRYTVRDALPWISGFEADRGFGNPIYIADADYKPYQTVGSSASNGSGLATKVVIEGTTGFDRHEGYGIDQPMASVLADRPVNISGAEVLDPETGARIDLAGTAVGRHMERMAPGATDKQFFNLVRSHPDKPVQTVSQRGGSRSTASVVHPSGSRKFTIAELRRICGFPDDFVLTGTYAQQWERLGRAVPPVMMSHIARAVAETLCAG